MSGEIAGGGGSVQLLRNCGEKRAKLLANAGIHTIYDMAKFKGQCPSDYPSKTFAEQRLQAIEMIKNKSSHTNEPEKQKNTSIEIKKHSWYGKTTHAFIFDEQKRHTLRSRICELTVDISYPYLTRVRIEYRHDGKLVSALIDPHIVLSRSFVWSSKWGYHGVMSDPESDSDSETITLSPNPVLPILMIEPKVMEKLGEKFPEVHGRINIIIHTINFEHSVLASL